jgi:hypothetical protein
LNGFPKAHVIGKDAVHFFEGKLNHPDESLLLVVFELTSLKGFRLSFAEGILEFFKGFGIIDFFVKPGINL